MNIQHRPILIHAKSLVTQSTGVTTDLHVEFGYGDDGKLSYIDVSLESVTLLMECQLTGAMDDYIRYGPGEELFENAKAWFFDEAGEEEDLSCFLTCCRILGLNPDKVRFLANWHKDKGKKRFYHLEFGEFLEQCK